MSHEFMNLESAAAHVHVDGNELKHAAQRGEIESQKRGDEYWFEHRVLDEWAQRNLLASSAKEVGAAHREMSDQFRRKTNSDFSIADLFRPDGITLDLKAKAKAGAIRDMTDLQKRPSTSELLDWIQALMISGVSITDLYEDMPFLGVLLKKNQDVDTFEEIKTKGYSLRNW